MRQSPTSSSCSSNYVSGFYPFNELFAQPIPEISGEAVTGSAANELTINADEAAPQAPALSLTNPRVQRTLFERERGAMPLQNPASLFDHLPGMTQSWTQEREENPVKRRRNLTPTSISRDLGQNPIIPPAPSPLLNLLSSEHFSNKLTLVFDQDQNNLRVNPDSLEALNDIVRLRRQLFKHSTPGKLTSFDDESKPVVLLSFEEMIHTTRRENSALIATGKPAETYKEQMEILQDFLSDRVDQKRAMRAQDGDDHIEGEDTVAPNDSAGDGIDDILEDLLPQFALDLVKAHDEDLTKRFLQAQQLAILITLIR